MFNMILKLSHYLCVLAEILDFCRIYKISNIAEGIGSQTAF